jgi:hypothetical protein
LQRPDLGLPTDSSRLTVGSPHGSPRRQQLAAMLPDVVETLAIDTFRAGNWAVVNDMPSPFFRIPAADQHPPLKRTTQWRRCRRCTSHSIARSHVAPGAIARSFVSVAQASQPQARCGSLESAANMALRMAERSARVRTSTARRLTRVEPRSFSSVGIHAESLCTRCRGRAVALKIEISRTLRTEWRRAVSMATFLRVVVRDVPSREVGEPSDIHSRSAP